MYTHTTATNTSRKGSICQETGGCSEAGDRNGERVCHATERKASGKPT